MAEAIATHESIHNNLYLMVGNKLERFKTGKKIVLDKKMGDSLTEKKMVKPISGETTAVEAGADRKVNASPAARELADVNNIDLATIEGTGKDGAISKPDVQKAIDAAKSD